MVPVGKMLTKLLRLAWPVALARLGIMGMSVVDVMVVGQFVPSQLAYQALALAPIGALTVTGIGLLSGVQVLAARALGEGAPKDAGAAWRRGLVVSALAGAVIIAFVWLLGPRIFTVFGVEQGLATHSATVARVLVLSIPMHLLYVTSSMFCEAIQRPMASTVSMWGANLVNLLLNLWLVPRLGAVGSAWCTVGARFALMLGLLLWLWRLPDAAHFGLRQRVQGPGYGALLRIGAAAAVSSAAESGAFSGMTVLAARQGPDAVSTYQILLNLLAIVFMVALGVSSATGVLTSEAVGRRAVTDATRWSFGGLFLNTGLMLLASLVVLGFATSIGRAYTANLSLAATVSSLMWLVAAIYPPDGGQVVTAAALRARGDNWFPTASHLLSYAAVMPALAYWLAEVRGKGVAGLMLAIFWSSVLSCGVLCLRSWWLHSTQLRTVASKATPTF